MVLSNCWIAPSFMWDVASPKSIIKEFRLQLRRSGPGVSCAAFSAARLACRVFDVRTRIADEHATIWHLNRAERAGVERRASGKQPVQIEDVRRDCIDVVIAQRLRRVLRHGAPY